MKDDDQEKSAQSDSSSAPDGRPIPLLEWLVAAFGLIVVLGALGLMIFEAITQEESPPDITVTVETVVPNGSGYVVQVRVINQGGSTAAAIMIEGELKRGDESIEISEATIDYVPDSSTRHGGLFFTHNPAEFELTLRAKGYQEP